MHEDFRRSLRTAARRIMRERVIFERTFPLGYFRDPLMESLLTFYLGAEHPGSATSGSTLGSPRSTTAAERWLAVLLNDGLAERRETLVTLTAAGTALVEQALSEVVGDWDDPGGRMQVP